MTETLPTTQQQKKATAPNLVKAMLQPLERAERLRSELSESVAAMKMIVPLSSFPRSQRIEPPDVDTVALAKQAVALRGVVTGPTDARAARAGFTLMLSALPNASKFDASVYLDGLIATVLAEAEGAPPTIIAATVRSVWRSQKFIPTISEILAILREERANLLAPVREAEKLIDRVGELNGIAERQRNERADFEDLRAKARAAGDQSFDDVDTWEFDQQLERLRLRYGKTSA